MVRHCDGFLSGKRKKKKASAQREKAFRTEGEREEEENFLMGRREGCVGGIGGRAAAFGL